MNRNSDILILLLLLALLAELRQTEAGAYAQTWPDPNVSPAFSQTSAPTSFYGRPGRLRMPEPARLIGDFHRMTEVMGKVDHLGQMAVNPQNCRNPQTSSTPLPCRISAAWQKCSARCSEDSGTETQRTKARRRHSPKKRQTPKAQDFPEKRDSPAERIFSRVFAKKLQFRLFFQTFMRYNGSRIAGGARGKYARCRNSTSRNRIKTFRRKLWHS